MKKFSNLNNGSYQDGGKNTTENLVYPHQRTKMGYTFEFKKNPNFLMHLLKIHDTLLMHMMSGGEKNINTMWHLILIASKYTSYLRYCQQHQNYLIYLFSECITRSFCSPRPPLTLNQTPLPLSLDTFYVLFFLEPS